MNDELDQVVRGLEAERHRPSVWWHRAAIGPNCDVATELDRLRELAINTETLSTSQGDELLTSIKEAQESVIHRHVHRAGTGRYARADEISTPDATTAVDDDLYAADLPKDTDARPSEGLQ